MILLFSDLITTIIYPSKYLHQGTGGTFGSFGSVGCGVMEYTATTCAIASSYTLAVISVDR